MPTYTVTGINIGTFNLGEADKILTIFSAQRGLIRAVAKGARKPGAKMTGKSDLLNVNTLFVATGRSLDIITQAESLETFPELRRNLARLSNALYYAELSQVFGQGLAEESQEYFEFLKAGLKAQADPAGQPEWLVLCFELGLLNMLGLMPELDCCVSCRSVLTDYALGAFHHEWGGIICRRCLEKGSQLAGVYERSEREVNETSVRGARHVTPLVWKQLVSACKQTEAPGELPVNPSMGNNSAIRQSLIAARRLIENYLEYKAGRKMKSLDLVRDLGSAS